MAPCSHRVIHFLRRSVLTARWRAAGEQWMFHPKPKSNHRLVVAPQSGLLPLGAFRVTGRRAATGGPINAGGDAKQEQKQADDGAATQEMTWETNKSLQDSSFIHRMGRHGRRWFPWRRRGSGTNQISKFKLEEFTNFHQFINDQ